MARNTYTLGINSYLSQGSMHASHRFEPCTYLKYTEYIGTSYEGIMFSSKTRELSAEERVSQHRMLQRDQDYAESYFLLLELGQRNPVTCKAFHIIEAQVLHGEMCVYLRGALLQPKFQRFLNLHYFDFARQALRAMFVWLCAVACAQTFVWRYRPGSATSGYIYLECCAGHVGTEKFVASVRGLVKNASLRRKNTSSLW
jgi:hypothetical protein